MALSEMQLNIYTDIRAWVAEETSIRGKKRRFVVRSLSHAKNEYADIVENRLPTTWVQFQELREKRLAEKSKASLGLKLKVGQQALLACALAEESLAFEAIIKGHNPVEALHTGFKQLDRYIDNLRQVQRYKLPENTKQKSVLDLTLRSAVATYNGDVDAYDYSIPRLQTVAGLAIVALHEQAKEHVLLPAPGHKPGVVEIWSQPRLHIAHSSIE
jgi:hypothetical protein